MRSRHSTARLLAAAIALTLWAPPARADEVTPAITQNQANRLSIFHDYALDVVGQSTGTGGGVAAYNYGGYTGTTPLVGEAGRGAAANAITSFSERFPFLRGIQSTDPVGSTRPFEFSAGFSSGYDSNPKAQTDSEDASFAAGALSAAYRYANGPVDPVVGAPLQVNASYTATGVVYEGNVAAADALQHGLAASLRQSYADNRFAVSAAVDDQFTMLHGAAFLNTTDASVGGEAFVANQLSVEGGYGYTHLQYFFQPVTFEQRPTADRHTANARLHLYTISQHRGDGLPPPTTDGVTAFVQKALRRATVGYAHVWNAPSQTTGSDYRYQADRVYVGLEGLALPESVKVFGQSLGQGTTASVLYAHEFQDYKYNNSASLSRLRGFGPGTPRYDDVDVFTIRSDTRIVDFAHGAGTIATFLQLDLFRDHSNIGFRGFNEFVFSSGFTYRY